MIDLEDLGAFVEVAEAEGFGRAARRLGVSTSIISRRLARLEGELGAQLLTRTTRGVALTEAGVNFRIYADRVLADLEAARDAVAQDGEAIIGSLRIAAPLSFGSVHLAPALAELAARHPRLQIETDYSDRYVNLIAERFDVAVRIGQLQDSSLIARKIAPIMVALVASPDYVARNGEPKSLADLDNHEAVAQPGEVWRFIEDGKEAIARPHVRFRANSGAALVSAAVAGVGIAMLPTFLLNQEMEQARLVRLLPKVKLPEAGLFIVRPPPGPAPGKIRALTDLMIERFGGQPDWDKCYGVERARADAL